MNPEKNLDLCLEKMTELRALLAFAPHNKSAFTDIMLVIVSNIGLSRLELAESLHLSVQVINRWLDRRDCLMVPSRFLNRLEGFINDRVQEADPSYIVEQQKPHNGPKTI